MTISYRDAASRPSTTRQQDARQVKVLSQNWKPVPEAETLAKHTPLSHAIQGATSSSSAPASRPSARASDLERVVTVEEVIHFGSFNDDDPASNYYELAPEVAKVLDQESVEVEFKRQSKTGGISRNEEERVKKFTRLPDDGEIKLECLGSESNASKNFLKGCQEDQDDILKNERFISYLVMREAFSNFRETKEGRSVDARMKEVLMNLLTAKNENFVTIIRNVPFFRMLTLTIFQAANIHLKANFSDPKWRNTYRFPKCNSSDDYDWWDQNFDPEIARKRLEIMEEAAKNAYPHENYYMWCQFISSMNVFLHPWVDVKGRYRNG